MAAEPPGIDEVSAEKLWKVAENAVISSIIPIEIPKFINNFNQPIEKQATSVLKATNRAGKNHKWLSFLVCNMRS
jgi:hypothetical protein